MARLKNANFTGPVTSQNSTLDEDPKTFPTDQRFYFDFTHDSVMVSVLAALNFSQFDAQLDPIKMDPKRNFITSHLIPFAARLFFEVGPHVVVALGSSADVRPSASHSGARLP